MPVRTRRAGRFRPRGMRTEREKREYVIALYAAAGVKLALFAALVAAAVQAFRAAHIHAAEASPVLRYFLPLVLLAGGVVALRGGVMGMREARSIAAAPVPGPDDSD